VLLRARVGRCLEKRWARHLEREHTAQIEREKEHVERLLHTLFPRYAAEELKATNHLKPVRFNDVAILFCDIVNYTRYSEAHLPERVLADLHALFVAFEEITDRYRVEKISAMGDEYMAVAGFEPDRRDAVFSSVAAGQEMIAAAKRLPTQFDVRIGVHVGNVVGGIVGNKKFHYSVWGDAVNVASRMQSNGLVGSVNVSRAAWDALHGTVPGKSRGIAEIKGKGPMEMFVVYPRVEAEPLGAAGK
jgi:class 3 adenylate cyclase